MQVSYFNAVPVNTTTLRVSWGRVSNNACVSAFSLALFERAAGGKLTPAGGVKTVPAYVSRPRCLPLLLSMLL